MSVTVTEYFATCAGGLENIVAGELRALNAADVQPGRGGVQFRGDKALLYQANLWLRTAVRVLVPILKAEVHSPEELYDAVRSVGWSRYLTPDHTLAVDANVRDSRITHSRYAALKVKDAICDQQVEDLGRRSSVNVDEPMVGLNLHIYKNQAVLSLDSTGESLHKRGYRPIQTRAPLNEALAAALLQLAGYDGSCPFLDPMCGGGTLCIEAAWIALGRPPGLTRRRFGFMGWMDYEVKLWTGIRDEARRGVKSKTPFPIRGHDERRDALQFAQQNARAAGVGHALPFELQNIHDLQPPAEPTGILLCNPPYGERLGEEQQLRSLYRTIGEVFARFPPGWKLFVFTGNANLGRQIQLELRSQTPLYNGRIPCQLLEFGL